MSLRGKPSGRGLRRWALALALLTTPSLAACDDGPAIGDAGAGTVGDAGADAAGVDGGRQLDSGRPPMGGGGGVSGGFGGCGGAPSEPLEATCGNGVIDQPLSSSCVFEQCDGEELGGASCELMGLGPGELRCNHCHLDPSDCAVCPPLDEQLVACEAEKAIGRSSATLAVKPGAIALAWSSGPSGVVGFQRLTPELDPIGEPVAIEGKEGQGALLAIEAGWLLALQSTRVEVIVLDEEGGVQRELAVADPGSDVRNVTWVEHPEGDPLLLWSVGGWLFGAVIAADGSASRDVRNLPAVAGVEFGATYVADGFLIVTRLENTPDHEPVTIRVSEDGEAAAPAPLPYGASPALARTARGTVVSVYLDTTTDEWFDAWAELDATGTLVSGPVKLDAEGTYLGSSPTLLTMDDGFALISTRGYVPLDQAGVPLATPKPLFVSPWVNYVRAIRSGSDVVVTWGSPYGLARLRR